MAIINILLSYRSRSYDFNFLQRPTDSLNSRNNSLIRPDYLLNNTKPALQISEFVGFNQGLGLQHPWQILAAFDAARFAKLLLRKFFT